MASDFRTSFELKISLKYFSSSSLRFSMFSGLSLVIPKIFFLGNWGLYKEKNTNFLFCSPQVLNELFVARYIEFWRSIISESWDLSISHSRLPHLRLECILISCFVTCQYKFACLFNLLWWCTLFNFCLSECSISSWDPNSVICQWRAGRLGTELNSQCTLLSYFFL